MTRKCPALTLRDLYEHFKISRSREVLKNYAESLPLGVKAELILLYGLTQEEAEDLHYLIVREVDPSLESRPSLNNISADTIKEFLVEGEHSSWDGWDSEHDRLVLDRLLDDLIRYNDER